MADAHSSAQLLADGQAALLAKHKARAEQLLRAAIVADPQNEEAWLWLSGVVAPAEAAHCLHQVLRLNPANSAALEGLAWLKAQPPVVAANTAPAVPDTPAQAPAPVPTAPPDQALREQALVGAVQPLIAAPRIVPPRSPAAVSRTAVSEAATHVAVIGSLLGLVRLVVLLRPQALLVGRGEGGALSWGGAAALALAAAASHAGVLLLAWWLLGDRLALLRNDQPDHRSLSLVQAGRALLPGYLVIVALGLALASVGLSERRWFPAVALMLAAGGAAVAWAGRQLLALRSPLRISMHRRGRHLVQLLGPPLLAGAVGLWMAGLLVAWLVRTG